MGMLRYELAILYILGWRKFLPRYNGRDLVKRKNPYPLRKYRGSEYPVGQTGKAWSLASVAVG